MLERQVNRAESVRLMTRAHGVVCRAKKVGLLPKLDGFISCFDCSQPATEYDHRDYFKPLDVDPVCHKCNIKRGAAYPFTVESRNYPPCNGTPQYAKINWEYDGITQRLVETPFENRYQKARYERVTKAGQL